MSSDSVQIENTSTIDDACLSTKNDIEGEKSSNNNRKDAALKLPYPVVSDHRDPSSVLILLQKETQTTSKKILDVTQQVENCEKQITSNSLSDSKKTALKYERVKLKQQLDALKKHERRVNLQIDFVTTKVEIKGLEDERKQVTNEENSEQNKQINGLLGKLKQKLDKMKIYMRTRNEQMKKIIHTKQRSSTSDSTRRTLTTSQKPAQQQPHRVPSNLHKKRPLSSSAANSHPNKRLAIRTPIVRFINKSTGSSVTTLNSSSPTTPASSSSTLSPPSTVSTTTGDAHNSRNSLSQIEIPSIDDDDELDLELNIDELFNDDPYSEEILQEYKSDTRPLKINHDSAKTES